MFLEGTSPSTVLLLIARLTAIGHFIIGCELLAGQRAFGYQGAFDWRVIGLSRKTLFRFLPMRLDATRKSIAAPLLGLVLCGAAAALLIGNWSPDGMVAAVYWVLVVAHVLLRYRLPVGRDGADELLQLIATTLAIASMVGGPLAADLAVLFITGQLIVAYTTAGAAKLAGSEWRNGAALSLIVGTNCYGNQSVQLFLLEHRAVARCLGFGVIAFELSLLGALMLPMPALMLWIGAGCVFHAITAMVMGLNTFLWAFCGSYPALLIAPEAAHAVIQRISSSAG